MGLNDRDASIIVDDLVEAELEGKSTHGVGKLLSLPELLKHRDRKI